MIVMHGLLAVIDNTGDKLVPYSSIRCYLDIITVISDELLLLDTPRSGDALGCARILLHLVNSGRLHCS